MGDRYFPTRKAARRAAARARRWACAASRPLRPRRAAPRREGPPNLLVVAVDTLRYDHLGLSGHPHARTDAIDALARGGVSFADVTAPAPWTLPSFASALTGVMPSRHGAALAGERRNLDRESPRRYGGAPATLSAHLAAQGYRTAAFTANPFFGFGLAETFAEHRYHNLPAHELAFLAEEWIRRHGDRPFFCFVLLNDPHEPTAPPRRLLRPLLHDLRLQGVPRPDRRLLAALERWGDERAGVELGRLAPPLSPAAAAARAIKLALYDAAVAHADAAIGRLWERLVDWGLEESTVVSVFSDHGEEFLDHLEAGLRWRHDPRGLHGIGHGHALFQEVLRVPWVAAGPGLPAGARVPAPASLCDVAPTLCAWVGAPPLPLPETPLPALNGCSLAAAASVTAGGERGGGRGGRGGAGAPGAPAAVGAGAASPARTILSEDIAYGPDLVAVRQDRWKLIARRSGEPLALFDLANDPGEHDDLAAARADVVAALGEVVAAWRAAVPAAPAAPGEDVSDRVRRQLKELGYSD